MKTLFVIVALAISASSFASITKTDSGYVSWTVNINKKKEGVLAYSRMTVQVGGSATASQEEQRMALRLGWNSGVGGRQEYAMKFEHADERSQESVEEKIKGIVSKDIADVAVTGEEAEVKLTNVSCKESGFLKKKLNCSAEFEHVQILNLK